MALVTSTVTRGIAHVELARAEKLNSLTLPFLSELIGTAHHIRRNRGVRAVVISGQGRSFCAGLDFGDVNTNPRGVVGAFVPRPWRGTNTFQEACWAWRRVPVPVIVAVHGHCFGGGLQIALAGDYRYTTADAQWSVMEGKWGLIPDMSGIQSLKELVGMDVAKKLTMTAEVFDGAKAVELGLASEISDDPLADALALASDLTLRSPDQLAAAKRLINRSWNSSARTTFRRERFEQILLLAARNTAKARQLAVAKAGKVATSAVASSVTATNSVATDSVPTDSVATSSVAAKQDAVHYSPRVLP